jgi:hypothetical protein
MNFDDEDNNNIPIYNDGCFPDASLILAEEEYFDKVLFDKALLQTTRFFHWIINSKQGYVHNGEFEENFKWALIYERTKGNDDNDNAIAFNFGDLLVYVPLDERLMWKQFYKDADIKIDRPDKLHLLFYDKNNDHDSDLVSKYWNSRIENLEETEDLPWWTKRQKEEAAKVLHYLKQFDQETKQWRDLTWMDFRPQVLDKYKNNELCEIGNGYISFLSHDKKKSTSYARFIIKNHEVLMMYAKDFNNVPLIERNHWLHYQYNKQLLNHNSDSIPPKG